jgi:tetratricopeptide (TPR) repeat protein
MWGGLTEMTPNVDSLILKAKELARKDDFEGSMSLANELAERFLNETRVWSLRGYLHGRNRNYTQAVADLTRAIEINAEESTKLGPDTGVLTSVDLFFNRGADRFALGDDESAVDDFTRGLELCDQLNSDDYRETLHFWRAEALLRLGKKSEALSDLARVTDGFTFWTYKLRTKADLLTDGNRLPSE